MKLQELLISLGYDKPSIHNGVTDEDNHILVTYKNQKQNTVSISLSYLLFSTPFLSLLEWGKGDSDFVTYDYDIYGILSPTTRRLSTHEHHKINLVLLNNDEERIKYIEAFTL